MKHRGEAELFTTGDTINTGLKQHEAQQPAKITSNYVTFETNDHEKLSIFKMSQWC